MSYAHRPDCDCEECWTTVYVSPPALRSSRAVDVSGRSDWLPGDLMGRKPLTATLGPDSATYNAPASIDLTPKPGSRVARMRDRLERYRR